MDKENKAFQEFLKISRETLESTKDNFDVKVFKAFYEKMLEVTLPYAEENELAKALANLAKVELEIINEDLIEKEE